MPVMREKQDLCLTGQLPKDFKPRRSAGIIEVDEQVVGDERKSVRAVEIIFDRGNPQRQIELICCTGAQPANAN